MGGLVLMEIDHLDVGESVPLVPDDEGPIDRFSGRQIPQKGMNIDLLELEREHLGFDPIRPVFQPSFAVRKAPKTLKKKDMPGAHFGQYFVLENGWF